MKIAVVDYKAGNIASVMCALSRLGLTAELTDSSQKLLSADRVIFPGVGHADFAMKSLREKGLNLVLGQVKAPMLGICLGMQLLFERSEEGSIECLGVVPGMVTRFTKPRKIPHVGWNTIGSLRGALFDGVPEQSFMYFVHSYKAPLGPSTAAVTDYEDEFSAAIEHKNFFGVQFHPEKSGAIGEQVLKNFLKVEM